MRPQVRLGPDDNTGAVSQTTALEELAGGYMQEATVLFTSKETTEKVIAEAAPWLRRNGARLRILVMQLVPFPEPLDRPTRIDPKIQCAEEIATGATVSETTVSVYLCRNTVAGLKWAVDRRTLVLVGVKGRFWWTRERRLARTLQRCGYRVYCVDVQKNRARAMTRETNEPVVMKLRWNLRVGNDPFIW